MFILPAKFRGKPHTTTSNSMVLKKKVGPVSLTGTHGVRYSSGADALFRNFHAESRVRPRARRLAITLRPPALAIRARNPCRRLRTSLLGWYVRFTRAVPTLLKSNHMTLEKDRSFRAFGPAKIGNPSQK